MEMIYFAKLFQCFSHWLNLPKCLHDDIQKAIQVSRPVFESKSAYHSWPPVYYPFDIRAKDGLSSFSFFTTPSTNGWPPFLGSCINSRWGGNNGSTDYATLPWWRWLFAFEWLLILIHSWFVSWNLWWFKSVCCLDGSSLWSVDFPWLMLALSHTLGALRALIHC